MKELLDEVDLKNYSTPYDLLSQIEIIDGVIRVDTAFIRRIVRERFDFGTPKYLKESVKDTDAAKLMKPRKINKNT